MADLILHAGTHKTGSSAIQSWLLAHADDLSRFGLRFNPQLAAANGNAVHLAAALCREPSEWNPACEAPWDALHAMSHGKDDLSLLISAERFELFFFPNIFMTDARSLSETGRFDTEYLQSCRDTVETSSARVRRLADELGYDKVIVPTFLRNLVGKNNSSVAQRSKTLKFGNFWVPLRRSAFTLPPFMAWKEMLEAAGLEVRFSVPELNEAPYSRQLVELAGGLDIPNDIDFSMRRENGSIGALTALASWKVMTPLLGAPAEVRNRAQKLYQPHFLRLSGEISDRPLNLFTPEQEDAYLAQFARLNEGLEADVTQSGMDVLLERKERERSVLRLSELTGSDRDTVSHMLRELSELGAADPVLAPYSDFANMDVEHGFAVPGPEASCLADETPIEKRSVQLRKTAHGLHPA